MAGHVAYYIPDRRELTAEENHLLKFLLERDAPDRVGDLKNIYVVARCGCGRCPTVLFGPSLTAEPKIPVLGEGREIASYAGRNSDGVLVGVSLTECDGKFAELEAWSPEGNDIMIWPSVGELSPF